MSTSPSEGLKTSENSSEPVFGNTNDDASARLVGLGAQSSSNNRHARDNFSPKAIDAGRTNGEASPRPVVPDFTRDNDPPTSTGTDILTESVELLKKIHQTLKDSTIAQESGTDDMSRFWATYKRHAEEYDSEFFDKYKDDMDIVLIFAGLFSAVSTAFLTAMQSSLSADPTDTTNALLMQVVHALNNSTFAGQNLEPPAWNGPGPTMTWVQSLIYASLSASLLAALGAVLGKQWLGQYRQKGLGMNDERGRRRQKKLDGLKTWHFHIVLEALPVLLQISLLLFSVALSAYVWTRQPTIGAVVISTTSLGVLFYVSITATAVISPNCPFQTPLSIALPVLWCFAHHIGKTALTATAKTMRRTQLRQNILVAWLDARQEPHRVGISKMYHRVSNWLDDRWRKVSRGRVRVSTDPESLRLSGLVSSPPPGSPLKLDIPPHRSVQDAPSVKWLLETSTDPDVITVAARNVPEVEWPAELNLSAAVAQLRNIFEGCFVYNNDLKTWQLAPSGRERALACGIALVYLDCEKSSTERWEAGDPFHRLTSSQLHEMFAVLRSENEECKCVSQVFFIQRLIMGDWRSYAGTPRVSPSGLQGGWWFHLLPHLLSTPRCPDNIKSEAAKQIAKQLSFTNLPSPSILADCLLSAAILVGVPIDREVFVKVNKSSVTESLLGLLLQHLPTVRGVDQDEYCHPVRYLFEPLALLWKDKKIHPNLGSCETRQCCCEAVGWSLQMCISLAQKAKALGPITDRLAEEKRRELWSNARAALHFSAVASARDHSRGGWYPTYGGHCDRLAIDDFVWAIDFLDYHYEAQDEIAVADTFFMLSQARPIALWARSPKFVGAIIFAMQPDRSTQVRHAALHTAWEIRIALGSPDDAMGPLLPKFAEALLSAVLTDIHPANQTETDYSPDRFTYYERDLRYLHILYTFAQNENGTWDELLRSKGHLQRCLDMVQHGSAPTLFLYLVAMVWSCESHDAEHHFLDDFNPKMRACQFADAWDHLTFVSHTGGWQTVIEEELEETLPALIALTRRYSGINNEPLVPVRNIQPVLEQLRECRPHSPMVPEIEDLVKWLKACDNSGSEVH